MDILFVGCSITWGDELKDRLNTRYSKLVCDALGANEHNIAECGQSNDWIARRTVEETRKRRYDRIQKEVGIKKRFSEPHPDDLEKKEFKLVESRSKRVKNRSNQNHKQRNPRRRDRRGGGQPDNSKRGKRKKRYSRQNDSPRNWGEEKRGRKGRKDRRSPRRSHRGNNRRRSER